MRWSFLLILFAFTVHGQSLRIDGGAAPMENLFKPVRVAFQARTGLCLELQENGPELSLLSLMEGKIDAAAAGLSKKDWLDLMAAKGHPVPGSLDLQERQIGFDRINVFLHHDLFLLSLDEAQLKGIFSGGIRNWKDLGGPDLGIVVILGTKVPGTNKVFHDRILGSESYTPLARTAGTMPEVLELTAATPGAVCIGPQASLRQMKLNSPATPEIGRPITLLTRGQPSSDLEKLLAFLGGEGRSLITK